MSSSNFKPPYDIPFDAALAVVNTYVDPALDPEHFFNLVSKQVRNIVNPWTLYLSSRTGVEMGKDLDISAPVALEIIKNGYPNPPPKLKAKFEAEIVPRLSRHLTPFPLRNYRTAFIKSRIHYIMRITRPNSDDTPPLNLHLKGYFYNEISDMLERGDVETKTILLHAVKSMYLEVLATRIHRFGAAFMELPQFPERSTLIEALSVTDDEDRKSPDLANSKIQMLFPNIVKREIPIVPCQSFRDGDQPISVTESKMKLFFGADFNSIRNRLMIIEPEGILAYFYGANVSNLKTLLEDKNHEEGE